jgi:hypothetical protein
MRVVESSPKSNSPASKPASRGRGLLSIALAVLASAFSFTPTAVHADTPVKGFFTDEEQAPEAKPQLPPAQPQATATASVSAQAGADASVNVAVEGDEFDLDTDPSALSDFREPLEDYGTWTDDTTYGTVWYPDTTVVGSDFAPYQTSGHWELDANDDWMWVSDYDWGHIPFHYGRWVWVGGRGWGWIPGRVYAPAWVSWRMTDYGYVGWAPMAPSWYWFGGSAVNVWTTPYSAYVFCPSTYVFHRQVHTYVVRDRDVIQRIGAHSRPYRPARPSVAGAASSSAARGARAYRPASPSLRDAKIPDSAAPQKRSAPDARAVAFSRRSTTPQRSANASRSFAGTQVGRDGTTGRTNPAARPTTRVQPGQTPRVNDSSRPTVRPDSSPSVSPSRPSTTTTRPSTTTARPSTTTARPSTTTTRPSTTTSRPSVSPSRPSTSRPSVSPSRPSVSPSRPSVSPSRPSGSPSRGRR